MTGGEDKTYSDEIKVCLWKKSLGHFDRGSKTCRPF